MYLVLNATQGVPDFGPVAFEGVYLSLSVSVGQTEDLKISIMRNYLIYYTSIILGDVSDRGGGPDRKTTFDGGCL